MLDFENIHNLQCISNCYNQNLVPILMDGNFYGMVLKNSNTTLLTQYNKDYLILSTSVIKFFIISYFSLYEDSMVNFSTMGSFTLNQIELSLV